MSFFKPVPRICICFFFSLDFYFRTQECVESTWSPPHLPCCPSAAFPSSTPAPIRLAETATLAVTVGATSTRHPAVTNVSFSTYTVKKNPWSTACRKRQWRGEWNKSRRNVRSPHCATQTRSEPARCETDTCHGGSRFNLPFIPAYYGRAFAVSWCGESLTQEQWVPDDCQLQSLSRYPDNDKKDAEGCAAASGNFRDTTLSPGYFWLSCPSASRLIIFFPQRSRRRHRWMGDHEVGLTRREEEGEGALWARWGIGTQPWFFLYSWWHKAVSGWSFYRLESRDSLVCFRSWLIWSWIPFLFLLIPGHPEYHCCSWRSRRSDPFTKPLLTVPIPPERQRSNTVSVRS